MQRIEFRKKFKKQYKKLPLEIQDKFKERLKIFEKNHFAIELNNHSVEAVYPGCRSINITGDNRAIFYEKNNVVLFIAIGTHAQLYE